MLSRPQKISDQHRPEFPFGWARKDSGLKISSCCGTLWIQVATASLGIGSPIAIAGRQH